MDQVEELNEQIRVLRERIALLERAAGQEVDPALRLLLEHTAQFLAVVSPEGRMLATGRVSEGFGNVVGRDVRDFTNPSHRQILTDALARASQTQKPVAVETMAYGETGEPDHTYITRCIPVVENGRTTALVLVPTDITERVRLQRSLEESERAMRFSLDATRMGLWRWDLVHDKVKWDARVLEIFRTQAPPPSAAAYMEHIHPDDRALVQRVIDEARTLGVYPTFEHRLAVSEGEADHWILCSGAVQRDASGTPAEILGGVLDITEQKRMALQMQRVERVDALGQLSAGIAHNFNNLLAAILPNIELAARDASERSRGPLAVALDASLQARELVKGLLAFAGRHGTANTGRCDPKDVVTRIEAMCRQTFPREIELLSRVEDDAGHVAMPASNLEQVLLNLLLNARDAVLDTVDRTRRIEIVLDRVRAAADGVGTKLRLRVIDNGAGMSEAVRRKIFEPFFSTKPPHRGSGLGLANALVRVREAHGTLECTSEAGVGTTFTLLLDELNDGASSAASRAPSPVPPGHGGETLLIVDDEPLVRRVIADVLALEGYVVLQAGSAAEARELLERHAASVRLILLDWSMPLESGVEALASLKRLSAAPIVMFTGVAADLPPGATAVLAKPARTEELCRVIREVIRGAAAR